MVTKGTKVIADASRGVPHGQASIGTLEILAFEACRNGWEKVDCRGTALASENGARLGWLGEKNDMLKGLILGILDRKSTRLNSSHLVISYAVFCLKKKKKNN